MPGAQESLILRCPAGASKGEAGVLVVDGCKEHPSINPPHTASQFQPPLYTDALEKRLVMADDDERLVISTQPGLDR